MRIDCKYVPLLRGKQGEMLALKRLDPSVKLSVLPLIDIDDPPPTEKKPFSQHLAVTAKRLATAWGKDQEFILDTDRVESDRTIEGGKHYIEHFSEHLLMWDLKAILTCSLDRLESAAFLNAIAKDLKRSGGKLCIRLFRSDIEQPESDLAERLQKLLSKVGTSRDHCDLIVDVQVIDEKSFAEVQKQVHHFLSGEKCTTGWRSVVLVSSSFPNSLKGVKADTITEFPRLDFKLWQSVANGKSKIRRVPIYGDYGIVSALFSDQPDFRSANIPTKIRYAADDRWFVAKGGTTKKHGFAYFRKLAKKVTEMKSYRDETFSWGDKFIADCAAGGSTGNMASWVCVDTNHHITHVVYQLSS